MDSGKLCHFSAALLSSANAVLSSGSCCALGEIARNVSLPLPNGELNAESNDSTKANVIETLLKKISSTQEANNVCQSH